MAMQPYMRANATLLVSFCLKSPQPATLCTNGAQHSEADAICYDGLARTNLVFVEPVERVSARDNLADGRPANV